VINIHKYAIIPEPVSVTYSKEKFSINDKSVISLHNNFLKIGEYLRDLLLPSTGLNLSIEKSNNAKVEINSISLLQIQDREYLGTEGYLLEITPQNVKIYARNSSGAFYGVQTLRQLLPINIEGKLINKNVELTLPCVKIEDYPRFVWRGYMLDVARHFHGTETIKKILDIMALLKLNTFHWHLTDDQGWRIEIKKYPKLVEIGSKREKSQTTGFLSIRKTDNLPHSGYYSQEEIKEIIKYANDRFITIVPEIEMPGHARAALASYPNLSCRGNQMRVSPHWGIHKDIFCVGKEEVFDFIFNVLDEIIILFPSNVIHIGGDEVPKKRWKECSFCQSRLKHEKLASEDDLQVYFTNRIVSYLNARGKRLMGWSEILDEELKGDVIPQFWFRGKKKVIEYIQNGGNAIMSNFKFVYLDHSYSFTPLKLAYEFEPIPNYLEERYHGNILGSEALMWCEFVPNLKRLEWQTFPRLIALSEVNWTVKKNRNYKSFLKRLNILLTRFDLMGINYAERKKANPNFLKKKAGIFTLAQAQNGDNGP
jgi:hexosaminidase